MLIKNIILWERLLLYRCCVYHFILFERHETFMKYETCLFHQEQNNFTIKVNAFILLETHFQNAVQSSRIVLASHTKLVSLILKLSYLQLNCTYFYIFYRFVWLLQFIDLRVCCIELNFRYKNMSEHLNCVCYNQSFYKLL